jgi:hypothetical protein
MVGMSGVMKQQVVQYWYNIMEKLLKMLVQAKTLRSNRSPIFQFVFEIVEHIKVNLQEKKVVII